MGVSWKKMRGEKFGECVTTSLVAGNLLHCVSPLKESLDHCLYEPNAAQATQTLASYTYFSLPQNPL